MLVLHLKRFQYIPGQYFVHREKISELIDFPVDGLDLRKYVIGPQFADSPPIYDLYAVSHHMGGTKTINLNLNHMDIMGMYQLVI